MRPRAPEQTTAWVAEVIAKVDEFRDATVIGPHYLRITRKTLAPFVAGVISVAVVSAEIVQPVLDAEPSMEILVNVPSRLLKSAILKRP